MTFVVRLPEGEGREFTAVGMTDGTGHFGLTTFRPGDGAVAGSHAIMIEKTTFKDGAFRNALPQKYARRGTSGLTADVTEKGPNEFVFTLDDSGRGPK